MSSTTGVSSPASAPALRGAPTWDDRAQRFKTRRLLLLLTGLVVVVWLVLIGWVIFGQPIEEMKAQALAAGASLTVVLAPVIAAAAAVERTLETVFNIIEGSWHSLIALLGRGMRWLKNAETEMVEARQWLAVVSTRYNQEMSTLRIGSQASLADMTKDAQQKMADANALLQMAEQRLTDAEKNLAEVTSAAAYKSAKSAGSIVLGLMLGVIVAAVGSLQMFAMLGIDSVPAKIDVLVTGLVIGSGSYPVHSLVGLLQQAKDTLDSAKGALSRTGLVKQAAPEKPPA